MGFRNLFLKAHTSSLLFILIFQIALSFQVKSNPNRL
jgi:hypothetical protein